MLINMDSSIAQNPIKKCSYFLSRIEGPQTKGWRLKQYRWLKDVEKDRTTLPFLMDAWDVME